MSQEVESPNVGKMDGLAGHGTFVGKFTHALDPKRRLTIPAVWRLQVGDPPVLYVLPDFHEKCLCLFPAADWMRRIEKLRRHSLADRKARQLARVLGSQSELLPWDVQGRIRIKDELLAQAGLTDDVVLVGAFEYIEVWNEANLAAANAAEPKGLGDVAEYIGI
jgi:MraZ protein